MAQWLGALRTQFQFPVPTWPHRKVYNSSPMELDTLCLPLKAPSTQRAHRHTCRQNTHTNEIMKYFKKDKAKVYSATLPDY